MSYTLTRKIVPSGLKSNPNKPLRKIGYITIHNTGNSSSTATAAAHATLQYNGNGGNQVSWHYTVDEKGVWQSFDDTAMCWHAGDGANGTGNNESIAIEICDNNKAVFPAGCKIAAELTADLLIKHGLTSDKVVQHNNWSGKDCPKKIRAGNWGVTWASFLAEVRNYYALKKESAAAKTEVKWAAGTFKREDNGIGVYAAKTIFMALGYKMDDNGGFGAGTENAAKDIQKKAGLSVTGIIDAATIRAAGNMMR